MSVTDDRIFTHDDAQSLLTKQTDIKNSIDALTTAVSNQTINMVDRSTNQSIDGVKTFSSAPVITEVIPDSDDSTKAATTSWIESVFFNKLVAKLAASTAASISSLNTSSLFYRMLSWALTAAGVQYNFNNSSAWYICLGSLFGGLIIQGGRTDYPAGAKSKSATFPISWNSCVWLLAGQYWMLSQTTPTNCVFDYGIGDTVNEIKLSLKMRYDVSTGPREYPVQNMAATYIAIGK